LLFYPAVLPKASFGEGVAVQVYSPLEEFVRPLEARLCRRLETMLEQFTAQPGCSIPQASDDRNAMDAAYLFFANEHVSPAGVVHGCLPATQQAVQQHSRVLAVQDTSDFNFSTLLRAEGLGYTAGSSVRGLLLHSTLALSPEGLPLGLLTQQIWTRDPAEKGRRRDRRTKAIQEKESYRWLDHAQAARAAIPGPTTVVHIADREGDIYEWLAAPRPTNAHLLVRAAQPHRVVVHGPDGQSGKLSEVVRAAAVLGRHSVTVPRADDRPCRQAELTLRVAAVEVQPPKHAKQRAQLRPVPVWVLEAWEENPPAGQKPLCWRLLSTEPLTTLEEVVRALREYMLRWRIERFHFVLKQGCLVEQLQLDTAERLANALAVYSQVAVRLLRLAYLARQAEPPAVTEEFTAQEVVVLESCRQEQDKNPQARVRTVAEAVRVIARLGGHLGRKGDGPPGVKVLWRGLRRLHDRVLGFRAALERYVKPPSPPNLLNPSENYP
jgi:hypothetical protein